MEQTKNFINLDEFKEYLATRDIIACHGKLYIPVELVGAAIEKATTAGTYKIITLCGSTRFKDAFMREQKRLTLEGNIVINVGLFGHSGDEEVWENMSEGTLTKTKLMLDDMHKRKIDMADEIFVINENGYIGDSTKSEIAYAEMIGRKVEYLHPELLEVK